jgi:hypothetical protein
MTPSSPPSTPPWSTAWWSACWSRRRLRPHRRRRRDRRGPSPCQGRPPVMSPLTALVNAVRWCSSSTPTWNAAWFEARPRDSHRLYADCTSPTAYRPTVLPTAAGLTP